MITLKELLHSIDKHEKDGFVCVDDWRFPDIQHLVDMGFEFMDEYKLCTAVPPKIIVYKKKENDGEYFYVEEPDIKDNNKIKRFKEFSSIIDYFDTYKQEEIDKNR